MSSSELLLTVAVALIVFRPEKLPMLAKDLAHLWTKYQHIKQQFFASWDAACQWEDNQNKAKTADKLYEQQKED